MPKQRIIFLAISIAVAVLAWSIFSGKPQNNEAGEVKENAAPRPATSPSLAGQPAQRTRPAVPIHVPMEGVVPTTDAQMKAVIKAVEERVSKRGLATHDDIQEAHSAIRGRLDELGPSAVDQLISDFNVAMANRVNALPAPDPKAKPAEEPPRRARATSQ